MTALLLPSFADLAGWAGVAFATVVFIGLGRGLTRGAAAAEIALIAGWGVACLVLTAWGVATPVSLRYPAFALAFVGIMGVSLPGIGLRATDWRALARVLVLSAPLLAVMASARLSQPDTFLNLVPNAAYLYDHGMFPAADRPEAHSFLPGAPYNLQMAGFIAGLITPQFPATALIGFNVVLQLAAGLLLARMVVENKDQTAAPGWGATAFGLLLAMALNPGFVPRYHLSSYSEPSVMVVLAFAGYLALCHDAVATRLLAAVLAALVEIKQDSVALAFGVVLAAAIQPRQADENRSAIVMRAVLVAIPAAAIYLAWNWYVRSHFVASGAELTWMPLSRWQFGRLPEVFRQIAGIMIEKIVFFGPLIIALAAFAVQLWRGGGLGSIGQRAGLVLLTVTVVYNAALLLTYVGHFSSQMAADAHSYFRYNTHLALLLMVTLVLMLRKPAWMWFATISPHWRRLLSGLAIVVLLASPIVFFRFLRFDLETPQLRAWNLEKRLAAMVGPDDRIALILPGDNGSLFAVLGGLLRMTPPRRPNVILDDVRAFKPNILDRFTHDRWALISCTPTDLSGVPSGEAALYAHDVAGWRLVDQWPYPPVKPGHWSRVITLAPLCLPG